MEALTRLAARAEQDGAPRLAFAAVQDVLRTVHPRPKAVESDPEARVDLERRIAREKVAILEPMWDPHSAHLCKVAYELFGITEEQLRDPSFEFDFEGAMPR